MAVHMKSAVHVMSSLVAQGKKDDLEAPAVVKIVIEEKEEAGGADYAGMTQWIQAAVMGVNDRLVSVASLMVGMGAVNQFTTAMLVSGLSGLIAGACSMAIGEFVSVYVQYDIEVVARLLSDDPQV